MGIITKFSIKNLVYMGLGAITMSVVNIALTYLTETQNTITITKKDVNNDGLEDITLFSEAGLNQIHYGIIQQDSLVYLTKERIKKLDEILGSTNYKRMFGD